MKYIGKRKGRSHSFEAKSFKFELENEESTPIDASFKNLSKGSIESTFSKAMQ